MVLILSVCEGTSPAALHLCGTLLPSTKAWQHLPDRSEGPDYVIPSHRRHQSADRLFSDDQRIIAADRVVNSTKNFIYHHLISRSITSNKWGLVHVFCSDIPRTSIRQRNHNDPATVIQSMLNLTNNQYMR